MTTEYVNKVIQKYLEYQTAVADISPDGLDTIVVAIANAGMLVALMNLGTDKIEAGFIHPDDKAGDGSA